MSPGRDFFLRDAVSVAEDLVGYHLNRVIGENEYSLKIVETEAYCGPEDKASHASNNRITDRTRPMFKQGGHAYIYLIYGMYCCFNIVTAESGTPHAVLIRAGEPVRGIETMKNNRNLSSPACTDIASGPGKLCQALKITRDLSGTDLLSRSDISISDGSRQEPTVKSGKRINIDYAEEYREKRWRFFIPNNQHLSQ